MMEDMVQSDDEPTGERWDPLGVATDYDESPRIREDRHCDHVYCKYSSEKFEEKLKTLEDEQELLNSSLSALTTHFAQVQFRLRQAVAAPQADKEILLKSLEEFAFRGIPDVGVVRERLDEVSITEAIWLRRVEQQQLIEKLKSEIRELEHSVCKNKKSKVLQHTAIEKVILDELKLRINLELNDEYYQLNAADIRKRIDVALEELVTPLKMKDYLVRELQMQVADLERFVNYLQDNNKKLSKCSCSCVVPIVREPFKKPVTMGMVKRTAALLHMITIVLLDCRSQLYNRDKLHHWGDLRAKLEMAVATVLEAVVATKTNKWLLQADYSSDNESSTTVSNVQVITAVRKHLALCIRDLMQHGAREETHINRLIPFIGCFKGKSGTPIHAWKIITQYYHINNGEKFNSTPARKLSESFDLDISGTSCGNTNKLNMLIAIGKIISTHSLYKQSYDSHFKAFVSAGLNDNKLVTWLRLIFQCRSLLEMHYHPWSYAMKTGFSDSLESLDTLTNITFDLPVDLAIRRFQNITDVFM